ncbi:MULTISPECIES: hypothetical protein [unclassified Mycolicibacterium]|uniref:hypothetical protein n=1 Tax=unclassified Mycolicibacterium TaxID=2636767 RepID=UPI0012DF64D0|nr:MULTISPECIES: hypothetical protein [unclassified Mycolicibacterium]MUL85593.1 hypothetical protein [Mycolicibacterium sp. CBMA 329]MUL88643.1 hypothetical protein [Mycolicibacterium sp. CBMA 331]MUM02062.1 hypothetical protein [Mycolicibacterium sp. CBMA 334]MUM26963.1 hypothetical protein [Mycolicibacterium sp. CBMA 295]MUM40290.1 hypothetical protein [Mycolicibacterium sp. CBMA 247]
MTELLVLNAGKHELQAVSLDGARVRTLVAGLDELPDGIVVDQRRGHVYWTNMGSPDAEAHIERNHCVAAVSESAFYVTDLGGSVRHVDLDAGFDTELVKLGYGLTGIAVAEL